MKAAVLNRVHEPLAIEDLEMPPLSRRHKYPGLTSEEIERVRAWIDAGAPWPTAKSANADIARPAL